KARPGKLNFGSSGHGAAAHLASELFKSAAGVDIVHVPYKGAAPALQGVIAGHVEMMFATAASVVPLVREGKVRPLGVTSLTRTAPRAGVRARSAPDALPRIASGRGRGPRARPPARSRRGLAATPTAPPPPASPTPAVPPPISARGSHIKTAPLPKSPPAFP